MSGLNKSTAAAEVQSSTERLSSRSSSSFSQDQEALVHNEEQSPNQKTLGSRRALWGWLILCFSVSSL